MTRYPGFTGTKIASVDLVIDAELPSCSMLVMCLFLLLLL